MWKTKWQTSLLTRFALASIKMRLISLAWRSFGNLWKLASESSGGDFNLAKAIVFSGLFHYLNNEVMFLALSNVHPVTLAVGNTMKRVFIIVASIIVFNTKVAPITVVGSSVGIGGVLLYSLTKQHYEKLEFTNK